jgi:hypothetical protein
LGHHFLGQKFFALFYFDSAHLKDEAVADVVEVVLADEDVEQGHDVGGAQVVGRLVNGVALANEVESCSWQPPLDHRDDSLLAVSVVQRLSSRVARLLLLQLTKTGKI